MAVAEPPPPNPKNKPKCAPLAQKVDRFLDANRACASAADCVEVRTSCGTGGVCGAYVSRGKEQSLRKLDDELQAINCFALGAVPCPSCRVLPPAACVDGKCSFAP